MTDARKKVVLKGVEAVYHCTSRCVRRAFLCGKDPYTGKDYSHRKNWIRDRLKHLSKVFVINILQCAIMDNHHHTMLRTRPDLLRGLSDRDVAYRWLLLYPKAVKKDGTPTEESIEALCKDTKRIKELRKRLNDISWFMKSLNEYIARKANKEDNCKGRFWDGRFKCKRLEGEPSLLSCAMYIDLNPIRAKKADTPEESEYTSAWERINSLKTRGKESPEWLSPIHDDGKRRGFLSITTYEYLSLLDATGRVIKEGKRGAIPSELEPILTRIGIKPEGWVRSATEFEGAFSWASGNKETLVKVAAKAGKRWLKGIRFARACFI